MFHEFVCHPCTRSMLIFSVLFQCQYMCCWSKPAIILEKNSSSLPWLWGPPGRWQMDIPPGFLDAEGFPLRSQQQGGLISSAPQQYRGENGLYSWLKTREQKWKSPVEQSSMISVGDWIAVRQRMRERERQGGVNDCVCVCMYVYMYV